MSDNTAQILQSLRQLAIDAYEWNAQAKLNLDPRDPHTESGLSTTELIKWNQDFNRNLRYTYQMDNPTLYNIFIRHRLELMLAMLVAKRQITGDYQGSEGKAGIVSEYGFRAGYWGLGDDYRGNYISTTGSMQNWVHSGSTQLGGSAGNPILFGKNVVFCIIGYAIYSLGTPQTTHFQEQIDSAPQPVMVREQQWRNEDTRYPFKIAELNSARFLRENTSWRVQAFAASGDSSTVPATEYAIPIGVVYTAANILQQNDLGAASATTLNNLGILNTT